MFLQTRFRQRFTVYEAPTTVQSTKRYLLTYKEVEEWQRDNEYVCGNYRKTSGSYRESLRSALYLHNQTGNIYSHLVATLLFFAYVFYVYERTTTRYATAGSLDLLAIGVFMCSAIICFGTSASFHVFGNHSDKVYNTWLMLDLHGIFILISGTVFSGTYYGFYCEPRYWIIYSLGIIIIVTFAAILSSMPRFLTPKWRWARAVMFCTIGWSGAFPMTHTAQTYGIEQSHRQMGWWYFIWEGLSYAIGAFIYAMRMPERLRPGWFDIWGSSHQIFHICAVVGAALHLVGLLKAFDYNHDPMTRRC